MRSIEKFEKLLDQFPEYLLDENEVAKASLETQNIQDILQMFKDVPEEDRREYFDLILNTGRLDAIEAVIDSKLFNEEEVFNIALRFKMDDLRERERERESLSIPSSSRNL